MQNIENVELSILSLDDYQELKTTMIEAYTNVSLASAYWEEQHIQSLISKFPEGQIVIKVNNQLAGCALSIRINDADFNDAHTYDDITGTGKDTFNTHNDDGDTLYGIDVFIKAEFRGLRLGRRLYDYRKELCERLNLKGITFGGRIPNYHKYSNELSPKQYIDKVKRKEIHDPVLNFQISNDFHPARILKGYLEGDKGSNNYAVLLKWNNIYYEEINKKEVPTKMLVRLGLIQWQMRPYKNLDELSEKIKPFSSRVDG